MSTADFVYNPTRVKLGSAQIDLTSATVKMMFVGSEYAASRNDEFVSDIPSGAIVHRDVAVTATGLTDAGAFFGTVALVEALLSDIEVKAMVLYISTGDDTTSSLLYYSSTGPGFPFTAEGFDYYVTYDQSNGGWFQA